MNMKQNLFLIATVMLAAAGALAAEPPATISNPVTPGTISYQGRLKTPDGENYTNGVYGIEFRIYDATIAGDLLWGAQYKPYVQNGYFSVILGSTNVGETAVTGQSPRYAIRNFWKAMWIDPANTDPNNAKRYLEMTVLQNAANVYLGTLGADAQASFPRQQFLASPYAIQAQFAQHAAQAEYANQASGNFSVASNLTVNADFEVKGALSLDSTSVISGALKLNNGAKAGSIESSFGDWLNIKDSLRVYGSVFVEPGNMLKMGTHEVSHVVEAPESGLRIAYGRVKADGTLSNNKGITLVKRNSEGTYTINFTAFESEPIAMVSISTIGDLSTDAAGDNFTVLENVTTTSATVFTLDNDATKQDAPFNLLLLGVK